MLIGDLGSAALLPIIIVSAMRAVRLAKVFGGSEEGWFLQQAQYDPAHVRRDRLKLKLIELA